MVVTGRRAGGREEGEPARQAAERERESEGGREGRVEPGERDRGRDRERQRKVVCRREARIITHCSYTPGVKSWNMTVSSKLHPFFCPCMFCPARPHVCVTTTGFLPPTLPPFFPLSLLFTSAACRDRRRAVNLDHLHILSTRLSSTSVPGTDPESALLIGHRLEVNGAPLLVCDHWFLAGKWK